MTAVLVVFLSVLLIAHVVRTISHHQASFELRRRHVMSLHNVEQFAITYWREGHISTETLQEIKNIINRECDGA